MELIGLYLIASVLLVLAGVAKARRPDDTATALAELLGAPVRRAALRTLVRVGALVEAVLGAVALVFPRPVPAALVALSYLAFAAVVVVARRHGGALSTCACFGRPDTPPTTVHLVLNLVLAGSAAMVAAGAPGDGTVATELARQPWAGAPLLFVSAVGTWLAFLALSALGTLEGARALVDASARRGAATP